MLNSRCSTASICFSNIETTALERCSIDSALGGLRYSEYPVSGSNSSHALGNNMAFRKENEDDIDYSAATWELNPACQNAEVHFCCHFIDLLWLKGGTIWTRIFRILQFCAGNVIASIVDLICTASYRSTQIAPVSCLRCMLQLEPDNAVPAHEVAAAGDTDRSACAKRRPRSPHRRSHE
jgi:hypothetical protein